MSFLARNRALYLAAIALSAVAAISLAAPANAAPANYGPPQPPPTQPPPGGFNCILTSRTIRPWGGRIGPLRDGTLRITIIVPQYTFPVPVQTHAHRAILPLWPVPGRAAHQAARFSPLWRHRDRSDAGEFSLWPVPAPDPAADWRDQCSRVRVGGSRRSRPQRSRQRHRRTKARGSHQHRGPNVRGTRGVRRDEEAPATRPADVATRRHRGDRAADRGDAVSRSVAARSGSALDRRQRRPPQRQCRAGPAAAMTGRHEPADRAASRLLRAAVWARPIAPPAAIVAAVLSGVMAVTSCTGSTAPAALSPGTRSLLPQRIIPAPRALLAATGPEADGTLWAVAGSSSVGLFKLSSASGMQTASMSVSAAARSVAQNPAGVVAIALGSQTSGALELLRNGGTRKKMIPLPAPARQVVSASSGTSFYVLTEWPDSASISTVSPAGRRLDTIPAPAGSVSIAADPRQQLIYVVQHNGVVDVIGLGHGAHRVQLHSGRGRAVRRGQSGRLPALRAEGHSGGSNIAVIEHRHGGRTEGAAGAEPLPPAGGRARWQASLRDGGNARLRQHSGRWALALPR